MQGVLMMGDPKVRPQLITGFHGVKPPPGGGPRAVHGGAAPAVGSARRAPAHRETHHSSVVIGTEENLAFAAGGEQPTETYTTAGDYFYVREIPASLLTGDALRVDFQLDKSMPPSGADIRELGIIVLSIGLESK